MVAFAERTDEGGTPRVADLVGIHSRKGAFDTDVDIQPSRVELLFVAPDPAALPYPAAGSVGSDDILGRHGERFVAGDHTVSRILREAPRPEGHPLIGVLARRDLPTPVQGH